MPYKIYCLLMVLFLCLIISCTKSHENICFGEFEVIVDEDVDIISLENPIVFTIFENNISFIVSTYGMSFAEYERSIKKIDTKYNVKELNVGNKIYKSIEVIKNINGDEVISRKIFVDNSYVITIDVIGGANKDTNLSKLEAFLRNNFAVKEKTKNT